MKRNAGRGGAVVVALQKEGMAKKLRSVQRCLTYLEREVGGAEDPLLARIIGCAALLAAERATEYEEGRQPER